MDKKRTTVYFPKTLLDRLQKRAKDAGLSGGVTELLTRLSINHLESKGDFEIRDILNEEGYNL